MKIGTVRVEDLSSWLLDMAVARLQRIRVELFQARCVTKHPFDPEGPAFHYDPAHRFMLQLYEPSKDWAVGGPILEKSGIGIIACYENGRPFWRDDNLRYSGNTVLEAAMRAYVAQTINYDYFDFDRPLKHYDAAITVVTVKFDPEEIEDKEIRVQARTTAEAIDIGRAMHAALPPLYDHVHVEFKEWLN